MPLLTVSAGNSIDEIIATMAMVYAIKNWNDFAKEFKLEDEPELKEMEDDIKHITSRMLYQNHLCLNVLCSVWGAERLTEFVEKMLKHDH